MGCGKSKHDVVTGNTSKVRKPLEAESVKGNESETMKRQGSCRCRNRKDVSTAAVSGDPQENTVEIITKKPEEKEAGGDGGMKMVEKTEADIKPKKMETTTSQPVTATVPPENVVTEEKVTTISPPVTATVNVVTEEKVTTSTSLAKLSIVPENVLTEETVKNESVLPVDEQKEKIDTETVEEEEDNVEDTNDGNDDKENIPLHEAEEPKLQVETPATTEVPASKDEDVVEVVKEKPAAITKEVESS